MKIIELGKPAFCQRIKDTVTPTHLVIDRDGGRTYIVEPKGLKKDKSGQDSFGCAESELTDCAKMDVPDIDKAYFNSEVTTNNGFKGVITDFVFHLGGCVHAYIFGQTPNKEGKTWTTVEKDIRLLTGKGIKKLQDECFQEKKPSPTPLPPGILD